ncbi:MAG: serine hydrolase domain-containing protein [Planctomycetota bacterium]
MITTISLLALAGISILQPGLQNNKSAGAWDEKPVVKTDAGKALHDYLSATVPFGFSGSALAVKDGEVILAQGYGIANREKSIPFSVDTVIETGSITKQFTAAAILKLEEAGKLKTTDLISTYFKDVPPDKATIMIHHLLTHGSGLRSDFAEGDYVPVGREEYVKRALESTLLFKPGKGYEYSNAGFSLLAAIIEMVTGDSYEKYLYKALFEPAGMKRTGYCLPKWSASEIACGYRNGVAWGIPNEKPWAPDGPYWALRGNGGILTTLSDMLKWHRALLNDSVLTKPSREKMFTRHNPEPGSDGAYGYGWVIDKTPRGTTLIHHDGGNMVFACDFYRYVDEGAALILASNNAELSVIRLAPNLTQILWGRKLELPPKVLALDPASTRDRVGTYQFASGEKFEVAHRDSGIVITTSSPAIRAMLNGVTPERAQPHAELPARIVNMVKQASEGNYRPYFDAFDGQMPLAQIEGAEKDMWRSWTEKNGKFKDASAVISEIRPVIVRTEVTLQFEKGNVTLWMGWENGILVDIEMEGPAQPPRFYPVSLSDFVSWSPRMGAQTKIRFERLDGGKIQFRVVGGGEPVATKIKQ